MSQLFAIELTKLLPCFILFWVIILKLDQQLQCLNYHFAIIFALIHSFLIKIICHPCIVLLLFEILLFISLFQLWENIVRNNESHCGLNNLVITVKYNVGLVLSQFLFVLVFQREFVLEDRSWEHRFNDYSHNKCTSFKKFNSLIGLVSLFFCLFIQNLFLFLNWERDTIRRPLFHVQNRDKRKTDAFISLHVRVEL